MSYGFCFSSESKNVLKIFDCQMENSTELKDSRILSSFEDHKPHHNNPENKFIAIIGAEGY